MSHSCSQSTLTRLPGIGIPNKRAFYFYSPTQPERKTAIRRWHQQQHPKWPTVSSPETIPSWQSVLCTCRRKKAGRLRGMTRRKDHQKKQTRAVKESSHRSLSMFLAEPNKFNKKTINVSQTYKINKKYIKIWLYANLFKVAVKLQSKNPKQRIKTKLDCWTEITAKKKQLNGFTKWLNMTNQQMSRTFRCSARGMPTSDDPRANQTSYKLPCVGHIKQIKPLPQHQYDQPTMCKRERSVRKTHL